MEFSPFNNIVKLCIQGMSLEENGKLEDANSIFLQALNEASNDFERFLASFYIARNQTNTAEQLNWYQKTLELALKVNDDSVKGSFVPLYRSIAKCFDDLNDFENAKKNYESADSFIDKPSDIGPFYHGTKADLKVGDFLIAGHESNYKSELIMNHIYFTALVSGAGLAAALAKGDENERVYIVEPTGDFENDPNVTNKKFPGNPTRSYRTQTPLKIVGEIKDWQQQIPEELQKWREKLDKNKGKIIN